MDEPRQRNFEFDDERPFAFAGAEDASESKAGDLDNWRDVCAVNEIKVGAAEAFEIDERTVAVFNDGSEFFAIDDRCPHMGASLSEGHFEDHEVSCPWHAWRFDVRTGAWCNNRRVKIDSFPTRVVDGMVQINLTR